MKGNLSENCGHNNNDHDKTICDNDDDYDGDNDI